MLPKIAEALDISLEWFLKGPDTDDMSSVPSFRSSVLQEPRGAQRSYGSTRMRAHELVDQLSEQGVLLAIELLEGLSIRHPLDQTERAGHSLPALRAQNG